ncbi:unnamed protein product [Moneuplotes crassus]|uniref:Tubulin alpha chain n=1 Tax=Euplotes crassus TaxID=5936 RepID=A0AAD1X7S7_EUPCR|nr:unnamed protein product [Moneuplotes crassus]
MKEIVSLNIGRAGIRVGDEITQTFKQEHDYYHNSPEADYTDGFSTFFGYNEEEKSYQPRSLLIDFEPETLDTLKRSKSGGMYSESNFCEFQDEEVCNYARGYYTVGEEVIGQCMDRIQKIAEDCDSLQGFMGVASLAGGTGSGFGARVLEGVKDEFKSKERLWIPIFPESWLHTSAMSSYDCVLGNEAVRENANIVIPFDSRVDLAGGLDEWKLYDKEFCSINKSIAQVVSYITCSMRFGEGLFCNLKDISKILINNSDLKYLSGAHSSKIVKADKENETNPTEMLLNCLETPFQMIKCDPRIHLKIRSCAIFRNDATLEDINSAIEIINEKSNMSQDWFSDSFQWCQNKLMPIYNNEEGIHQQSGCLTLSNSASVVELFDYIGVKFDHLFSESIKCYFHHYQAEGMELEQFEEARANLKDLEVMYEQMEISPNS